MADGSSNIDLVFRNGLKEFEVLPPQDVWEGIMPSLRKPNPLPVYLKAAAVVGLAVASGVVTYYLSDTISSSFSGTAVTLNQDSRPEGRYIKKAGKGGVGSPVIKIEKEQPLTAALDDIQNTPVNSEPNRSDYAILISHINEKSYFSRKNLVSLASISASGSSFTVPYRSDITGLGEITEDATPVARSGKWSITAMISPAYFSKFDFMKNGTETDLANSEKAVVSYSGGFSFAYKINKRISLQTGLYYASLGQKIEGVNSYSGYTSYSLSKGGDNFSVQTSNGNIISHNTDIFLANNNSGSKVTSANVSESFDPAKAGLSYINSSLLQNFNYVEVPFILRYKFIERTLGMNLVGGISYNQLISNSAYSVSDGVRYYIGKTDGLYSVTLSSSLGLGMEYTLSNKLSINLEPTFRYFITPISGQAGSSIHPYSFGVLSGLSFRF